MLPFFVAKASTTGVDDKAGSRVRVKREIGKRELGKRELRKYVGKLVGKLAVCLPAGGDEPSLVVPVGARVLC